MKRDAVAGSIVNIITMPSHGGQPFGQIIKPDEVAELVIFIPGAAPGIMTGSVIDYDQNVMGAYD